MTAASDNGAVVHSFKTYNQQTHCKLWIRDLMPYVMYVLISAGILFGTDSSFHRPGHSSSRVITASAGILTSSELEFRVLYPLKTTGLTESGLSKVLTML